MMRKNKLKNSDILAVYRPSLFNQLFAFGVLVMLLLGVIPGYVAEWNERSFTLVEILIMPLFVGVCLLLLWVFFEVITRDKLILHDDGIECRASGTHYQYTWTQMRRFLLEKSDNNNEWGVKMEDGEFIPIDHFIVLPVLPFKMHPRKLRRFRKTRAGQIFYANAPQLFDELKKAK